MWAVIVKVELPEGSTIEQGRKQLAEEVIPMVKQIPGLVSAYWLSPPTGREGLSLIIVQDEAVARMAAEGVKPPAPVKLISTEVREVAASI